MTKSALVFDPFCQEFFDDPYEMYRRMRQEAPVYYSDEYDFYALTRHEDVAAAFKDYAKYSSAYGVDLAMVRAGGPPPDTRLLQFMDPPDHRRMRSVLNKLFTPRAIQAQRSTVTAIIDKYLDAIDGDEFDIVRQFTAPFPVEVITTMLGVPEDHVQQVRLWTDAAMHREAGQIEMDDQGARAVEEGVAFFNHCVQQHRAQPRDDLFSLLIGAEIERENGEKSKLSDNEIVGFAQQLGGAGAETVTKLLASAVYVFARNPDEWAKLIDDPGKISAAVEELLRYDNPVQYDVRCSLKEVALHGVTIPAGKPVFLVCLHQPTVIRKRGRTPTCSILTAIGRKRRTSGWDTAFTVVSARRSPEWRASSRWRSCSTSCRGTKSTGTIADASTWPTSSDGRACRCGLFARLATCLDDELKDLVRQTLRYKVPVAFEVVDELPRNPMLKVRLPEVAAPYGRRPNR